MDPITPKERELLLEGGWPPIPELLLRYMMAAFPAKCLQPGDDIDEHRHYGGKAALVEDMMLQYDEQITPQEGD